MSYFEIGSGQYRFESPLTEVEIVSRLNNGFPPQWGGGESAWYGDYTGRHWENGEYSGWIRFYFVDGSNYCKYRLGIATPPPHIQALESWRMMESYVLDEILPALRAFGLVECGFID